MKKKSEEYCVSLTNIELFFYYCCSQVVIARTDKDTEHITFYNNTISVISFFFYSYDWWSVTAKYGLP